MHAKNNLGHVLKFVQFVRKNNDVPFVVKRRVFDGALMLALLYGCESWMGADLKPFTIMHNRALKQLLSIRRSTPNYVCYAEVGCPPLPDLVTLKQHNFYSKLPVERCHLALMFSIEIVTIKQ